MPTYTSHSPEETQQIARDLVTALKGKHIIALTGELGAGKTVFSQSIAATFGITHLPSPTFTLMNVHQLFPAQKTGGTLNLPFSTFTSLVHIDCYRLSSPSELIGIGIMDYLSDPQALMIIEWANKISPLFPRETMWVSLCHSELPNKRIILVDNDLINQ